MAIHRQRIFNPTSRRWIMVGQKFISYSKLKFLINSMSVSIILSITSGHLWNSLVRTTIFGQDGSIFSRGNFQYIAESLIVLVINGLLSGTLAILLCYLHHYRHKFAEDERKSFVIRIIQIFTFAYICLMAIVFIKEPGYLISYR